MKHFPLAVMALLILDSPGVVAKRPLGLLWSRRMPAFAKRAFLQQPDHDKATATTVLPLRGGAVQHENHKQYALQGHNEEAHMPPRINAADMALALRWTGEVNRRIHLGTRSHHNTANDSLVSAPNDASYRHTMRGGGGGGETVQSPPLTLFHAKSPRPSGHGAARWGPSLEAYVQHISHALDLSDNDFGAPELSLALMYLDRATSAETPRSNGVPAVPFLQPRTAHRLVLAAMLLATHTTRGIPLPVLMERVESLGILPDQLAQMLQWMQGALGDPGFFVTAYSIQTWRHILAETDCLRTLLQSPVKDDEEKEQEEGGGEEEEFESEEDDDLITPFSPPSPSRILAARTATTNKDSSTWQDTDLNNEADNHRPLVGVEAA